MLRLGPDLIAEIHAASPRYCRALPHQMPHMAPNGTQWDEHGVRVRRANDPYRGEVK